METVPDVALNTVPTKPTRDFFRTLLDRIWIAVPWMLRETRWPNCVAVVRSKVNFVFELPADCFAR
jgi:hypothetical protein